MSDVPWCFDDNLLVLKMIEPGTSPLMSSFDSSPLWL